MKKMWTISLVLLVISLAVWSSFYLPGWIGISIGAVVLAFALVSTLLLAIGVGGRRRVGRMWREFVDFLYGL